MLSFNKNEKACLELKKLTQLFSLWTNHFSQVLQLGSVHTFWLQVTKSIKSTLTSSTINQFVAVMAALFAFHVLSWGKALSLTLCLRTAILGSHKLSYPLTVFVFLSILCLIGGREFDV